MRFPSAPFFERLARHSGVLCSSRARAATVSLGSIVLMLTACGTSSDSDLDDPENGASAGGSSTGGTGTGGGAQMGTGGDVLPGTGGGVPAGSGGEVPIGTGGTPLPGSGGGGTGGEPLSTEVTIEEDGVGHCNVDGVVESTHSGFSGAGYLNTDNAIGASIEWAVDVGEAGIYTLEIAYANEPAEDRPGDLLVDGVEAAPGVSFPSTSSWTTYSTTSVEVTLVVGENRIVLEATQASGLANIDSLTVRGASVAAFDCSGLGGTGGQGTGGGSGGMGTGGEGAGGTGTGGGGEDDDLCDVGVWDGSPPAVLSLSGNTFAHDPTMVQSRETGTFHRYWTGGSIPHSTSSNLTSWQNAPAVLNGTPGWANEWLSGIPGQTFNFPWAPDVSYFGGKYHIYSSFSAVFGRNISCITHLSTSNIDAGNWTDHGPVVCTDGSQNYNAIDADVAVDTEGTPWFSFGSFWGGIMAFELNPDGSRAGNDMTQLAWANQIEAPVLFRRCGYYYLFVTWGICCPGEGRSVNDLTYRVAVGRSTNIMGPYVDKNGTPMTEGGGTLLVQGDGVTWAAAGHSDVIATDDNIYHFYHAYRQSNGAAELRIVEMPFDDEGWPVAAPTP